MEEDEDDEDKDEDENDEEEARRAEPLLRIECQVFFSSCLSAPAARPEALATPVDGWLEGWSLTADSSWPLEE